MNDSKAFMEHGCQHYERHCRLKAKCCQRFLSCRRCHDDNPLPKCVREMDRKAVQYIQCCECGLEQLITEACRRCSQRFGRYFCPLCRHFDDDLSKKQFHCHGCGICRVGPREKYQHCDKCCVCYGRQTFENHKCVEDAMGRDCPVCMEFLHTTTKSLHVPACGHILHTECFQGLVQYSPRCPICNKSYIPPTQESMQMLDREIALTPMPLEYQNSWVYVLCNDCQEKTYVRFHPLGHKCAACGGYNTSQLQGPFANGLPPGAMDEMARLQQRLRAANVSAPALSNSGATDMPNPDPSPELVVEASAVAAVATQAVAPQADPIDREDDDMNDERADSLAMLEATADAVEQARTSVRMSLQEQEAHTALTAVAEADAELALLRGLQSND
eukprot:m.67817 g.67817  ORF g.67817 m.67817 type:complete len:388 (+) comp14088_c0_seq1:46-1209(+)